MKKVIVFQLFLEDQEKRADSKELLQAGNS